MSRKYGAIRQLGIVVRDPIAAMHYWADTLGVGPFYLMEKVTFGDYRYKGQPSTPPLVTLGFAHSDELQIEIIGQHNDAPSGYLDFLQSGRQGWQHVSSWFANHADYNNAYTRAKAGDAEIIHEGTMGPARFSYFNTYGETGFGIAFELAEGLIPEFKPLLELLKHEAVNWDGSDPIRPAPL